MGNEDELVEGGYAEYDGNTVRVVAVDFDGEGGVLIKPCHSDGALSSWGSKVVDPDTLQPADNVPAPADLAVGVLDPFDADNRDNDGAEDTADDSEGEE